MNPLRAILLTALCAGALSAQTVYHITDLGTLGGTSSASAGISANGTYVTGNARNSSAATHAFLYGPGGIVDLGTLGGSSFGLSINNTGQVAGYSVPSNDHAFSYSGGVMTDLGTLEGGTSASFGYGINNSGQIVGYSNVHFVNPSNTHQNDGFLYSGGTMQDLGLPPGVIANYSLASSYAMAITDAGTIVGYYTPDNATTHAFSLTGGVFTDLGTLNGTASGTTSTAAAINASGAIVGQSTPSGGLGHAFLYTGGHMQDLGTLGGSSSSAAGINASGVVVGRSLWTGSGFHGYLYSGGTMTDLNSVLDPAQLGYVITGGTGISDNGIVAATGTVPGGQTHALLLSPVTTQSQTLAFDAIPNQIFGSSPFPIAAQASSGLPVSFTSTTPAICKTASGLVTLFSAGTCSLKATQAGSAMYSSASATQSFMVSLANPAGTLAAAPGSPFTVGGQPRSVAVGDFNGDGIPDLVTANFADGNVTVLKGNGANGFAPFPGSPFGAGANPQSVAVGDFNGDGFQDLAVSNSGSNNVTVLLGNGAGHFTAATGSPITVGFQPQSLAVGDFNGDGIQDLAVANFSGNTVTLLLGNGLGGFTPSAGGPIVVGSEPASVKVGDFNGDGIQDLVTANFGDGTVTVLLGNGTGGFTAVAAGPFPVGANPYSVVVGNFNADGFQDLATADQGGGTVTVLLGNGGGSFTAAAGSPFGAGTGPYSAVVADFNGDGVPDLAAANFSSSDVSVLVGDGRGGFSAAMGPTTTGGTSPFFAAVGDFNGDGIPDLATANSGSGNVTVLLGGKASTSSLLSTPSTLSIPFGQALMLTLAVSPTTMGFNSATGTATFLDGGAILGTASQTATPYTFSTSSLTGGSHTLSATYGGDVRNYGSTSNNLVLQVTPAPQTITFGPLSDMDLSTAPFNLTATASSGLPVSYASSTLPVCTVSGATVTLVSGGTCSLTASQAGNANYAAATPVAQSFNVTVALSLCDINKDGNTNVVDVQLIINEALGVNSNVNDLNKDGTVNVVDVQIDINAALGLGCSAK